MSLYATISLLFITIIIMIIIVINNNNNNNKNTSNIQIKTSSSSGTYDNCLGSTPTVIISPIANNTIFADEETIIDASATVDSNNTSLGLTYNWDIFGNENNKNSNINLIRNQNKLILPKFSYLNNGNLKVIFTAISPKIPYLTRTTLLDLNVINNTPTMSISPDITSISSNPYTGGNLEFINNSFIGSPGNKSNLISNWYMTTNLSIYEDYRSVQGEYSFKSIPSTVSSLVSGNSIIIPSRQFIPNFPSTTIPLYLVLVVTNSNYPSKSVTRIISIDRRFRLSDIWNISISTLDTWSKSGGSEFRSFFLFPEKVTPVYPITSMLGYAWRLFDENGTQVTEIDNPIYRITRLDSPSLILKYDLVRDVLIVGRKYRFISYVFIKNNGYAETFYSNLFTVTP